MELATKLSLGDITSMTEKFLNELLCTTETEPERTASKESTEVTLKESSLENSKEPTKITVPSKETNENEKERKEDKEDLKRSKGENSLGD
jgi:hypothetical protein